MKLPHNIGDLLKMGGAGMFLLGFLLACYLVFADPQSFVWRSWARYVAHLERKLRLQFIFTPGVRIAMAQVIGVFLVLAIHALVELPFWYAFALMVIIVPSFWVERMRQQRVIAIEGQIDGFLMSLANALKATTLDRRRVHLGTKPHAGAVSAGDSARGEGDASRQLARSITSAHGWSCRQSAARYCALGGAHRSSARR